MKFLIIASLLMISNLIYGQSASSLFSSARVAYESGNKTEALTYLKKCENILGKTNPRIESLRVLCYEAQKDWVNAAISVRTYFRIVPSSAFSTTAHKDLERLRDKIELQLKQENENFIEEIDEKRMADAEKVINAVEQREAALYRQLEKQSAEKMFEVYRNSNDKEELQEYINMFPSSNRSNEIRFRQFVLSGDGDMAGNRWGSARDNYQKALKLFNSAPVRKKLRDAEDELLYSKSRKADNEYAYENYLKEFPNGRRKEDAEKALIGIYLTKAENEQTDNGSSMVKHYLDKIYPRFTSSKVWDNLSYQYYNIVKEELKDFNAGKKRYRVNNVSYAISFYEQLYPGKTNSSRINKLKRKQKAWGREDYFVWGFRRDMDIDFGFDFGKQSNIGIGWLVSLRGSFDYFMSDDLSEPFERKDREFLQAIGSFNLTKKIFHPIWIYAGPGYAHFTRIVPVSGDPDKGYIPEEPKRAGALNIEAGILFKLKPITLSFGVSMPQFSKMNREHLGLDKYTFIPSASLGLVL